MTEEFEDIRIVGLDKETVSEGSTSALFNVPLTLNRDAPYEWCEFFEQEWSRVFYTMKRRATASVSAIVLEDTGLDEVDRYHLEHLKRSVAAANERYREYLRKVEAEETRRREEELKTQADIDKLAERLRFDE